MAAAPTPAGATLEAAVTLRSERSARARASLGRAGAGGARSIAGRLMGLDMTGGYAVAVPPTGRR